MSRIYEPHTYGPGPIAACFWRESVPEIPAHAPPDGEITAEVAIIGAGYTGLNAALSLAAAGREVVVVEAEHPGWGASSRNGGFCCQGGAAASTREIAARFGEDVARSYAMAEVQAIDHVAELLDQYGIEADTHSDGDVIFAHRPSDFEGFTEEADELRFWTGTEAEIMPHAALVERGMASPGFYGGLAIPKGFALNPMKYVLGLARACQMAGVRIYGAAAVTEMHQEGGYHLLQTHTGQIRAKTLIIATNGYSSETLPHWLGGRYLPIQSNILVTRPLTEAELKAQGWTSHQMGYDSRNLLHYFRLMPDRRMLFGLRGAIKGTPAAAARAQQKARRDFERFFPAWTHAETPYFWSGLLCATRDLTPYVGPIPGLENAWAALGYHGDGVAMGSYSGHMLAAQITGRGPETPAPLRALPKRFELGPWRRWSLLPAYWYYSWKDRG